MCPSDSSVLELSTTQYQWTGQTVALTSYKGCIGDPRMGGASLWPNGSVDRHNNIGNNGLFYRNVYQEPLALSAIIDGTANTFAVGEDVPKYNTHSTAFYSNGDYSSCHAKLNFMPNPPTPADWPNVMSFRSMHNGGAWFCFADGGVRFIRADIDHNLYRALATRNGGEAASMPD
jgi:hypothetical protein